MYKYCVRLHIKGIGARDKNAILYDLKKTIVRDVCVCISGIEKIKINPFLRFLLFNDDDDRDDATVRQYEMRSETQS